MNTDPTMDRTLDVVAYHVHDPNLSFVRTDIKRFAAHHRRVLLFSMVEPSADIASLPGVEVICPAMNWSRYRPLLLALVHGPALLLIYFKECRARGGWMPFMPAMKRLLTNVFRAGEVLRTCTERQALNAWHYSFWWYDCVYLAWLRRRKKLRLAVTRTHGGDLFEERGSLGVKSLFRHYQLSGLDAVYSVSEAGTRYLHERYPGYADRIHTAYMGTDDMGMGPMPGTTGSLVLVSCAKVRKVKRVHLIAEALLHVRAPVRWVHIGGEADAERDPAVRRFHDALAALENKPNVEVCRLGHMDNLAVLEWYRTNEVHLFISLSAMEGLPVSMMEAISFGIPVLSTDVGGCREIVTERSGILVPVDISVNELAFLLDEYMASYRTQPAYRSGVRTWWQGRFDAARNYDRFFGLLGQLGRSARQ